MDEPFSLLYCCLCFVCVCDAVDSKISLFLYASWFKDITGVYFTSFYLSGRANLFMVRAIYLKKGILRAGAYCNSDDFCIIVKDF